MTWSNILKRLSQQELIVPYLEHAVLSDTWPDSYQVTVESGPYYGLDEEGKPDGFFHPSSHPLLNERLLYLMFHPETRDQMIGWRPSLQTQMAMDVGTALHAIVQTKFQMIGLCKPEDIEVEYINEEHHVRGRIDFIVDHPNNQRIPVEMKTSSSKRNLELTEILPKWDAQLSLGLDAVGADYGILLLGMVGYPFEFREFYVPRNDKLLKEIYDKFDRVREAIANNTPIGKCCGDMNECAARFVCG